jgi:hypothetical protein
MKMDLLDRRTFLAGAAGAAACLALPGPALAQSRGITMWKDPNCGCCTAWAERMQAHFRQPVRIVPVADMQALKRARGIPQNLWSCHTADVHGYLTEGHVPPADIQRLIASRSRAIRGLAVPGMPLGSPGMEAGGQRQRYQVFAFAPGGQRSVYATHN